MTEVLFEEVIRIHESLFKPEQSRFSKESVKYWGAKFPLRAELIGDYYIWLESYKRSSDDQRVWFIEIMNKNTGLLSKADTYVLPDLCNQTSDSNYDAKMYYNMVKNYIQNNGKVNI